MSNYEKKVCKIGEREYYVFETEIGGRTMSVEIGKYAEQANGSAPTSLQSTICKSWRTSAASIW